VRNTLLTAGTDYTIDYATGQVQFNERRLSVSRVRLAGGAPVEERAPSTVAPTSIYGLAARYDLGRRAGELQRGCSRTSKHLQPPAAGVRAVVEFHRGAFDELRFQPTWLTRFADGSQACGPTLLPL